MTDTGRLKAVQVCWTHDESDADSSLVYVPGVRDAGNRRPTRPTQVKGHKTREVVTSVPVSRRPACETLKARESSPSRKLKKVPSKRESSKEKVDQSKPSLKDLCAEDKQRVANLINELARLGDEKNKVAQELNNERIQFESRMKHLLEQQEKILQERQGVQQQLWECQNLLSRYQQIVSQQQDVLSAKIDAAQQNDVNQQDVPRDGSEDILIPKEATRRQQQLEQETNHQPPVKQNYSLLHDDVAGVPTTDTQTAVTASGQAPGTDNLVTDLPPERPRSGYTPTLPSSRAERPFTAYIDSLIASEQSQQQLASEDSGKHLGKSVDSHGTSRGRSSQGGDSGGTGPLHEPVLSSTHQSDLLSIAEQSRTKAGDYQPLLPDTSPRSSIQSSATQYHPLDELRHGHAASSYPPNMGPQQSAPLPPGMNGLAGGANLTEDQFHPQASSRVTFSQQLHLASPPAPHRPAEELSNEDFINFYRSMTPEERQRHLLSQKAALLAEQQRLRQVLEDQERLLCSKQEQLHLQQQLQRQRLEHFEKTGTFPPDALPFPSGPPADRAPLPPVTSTIDHPAMLGSHRASAEPDQPGAYDHQYGSRPPFDGPRPFPSSLRNNLSSFSNSCCDTDGPLSREGREVNGAEISKEEIEAVTDSIENLMFLERRGINVSHIQKNHTRVAHTPVGSSVMGPGPVVSTRPKAETVANLTEGPGSNVVLPDREGKKVRKTAKHRSSLEEIEDSDHAARLLALVDEVERSEAGLSGRRFDQSPEAAVLGMVHEADSEILDGEEGEEEESRILEEVFFVK